MKTRIIKTINLIEVLIGIGFILYYFIIGIAIKFNMSMFYIWPLMGVLLIGKGSYVIWLINRHRFDRIPKWISWSYRIIVIIGFTSLLILESLVVSGMKGNKQEDYDYLIVLGAAVYGKYPSGVLNFRIEEAYEYLTDNQDTIAIVSGGQGSGEDISEALCMKNRLMELGIDESRIIMEDQSTSTNENLEFSLQKIPTGSSVGIVTNNFHLYRSVKLADAYDKYKISGISADYYWYLLPHFMLRESFGLVADTLRGNISW